MEPFLRQQPRGDRQKKEFLDRVSENYKRRKESMLKNHEGLYID